MSNAIKQSNYTSTASELDRRYQPNPSLQANMISRILLAVLGTLLCWVPFRQLWRNGHVAAVVLIADVALLNAFTVLNALLWRSDDWDRWYDGAGFCDLEVYAWTPLTTVYSAAIFAIVLHLAQQVKLTRAAAAAAPTPRERRRRAWIQAAIIFPVPVVQLVFTWFILARRYEIGTLVGCVAVYDNSWPSNLVYDAPGVVFVLASVPCACEFFVRSLLTMLCYVTIRDKGGLLTRLTVLTWKRYRAISKTTHEALKSNSAASARANRTRLRLYNMSLSILCVYLPVTIYFTTTTIQNLVALQYQPYDYARIHGGGGQGRVYPWDAILFVPSWQIPPLALNQPWIPIATTAVIVAFFGTTYDAVEMYRRHAVALGLGYCFPRLREPYDPDRQPRSGGTQRSWVALLTRGSNKGKGVSSEE
ncbi:pheromone A receptor-domain-containing protein [Whalleya microplaca]|nr:pheromone A receptor-domain-containing protein [Whalleya microplaca]